MDFAKISVEVRESSGKGNARKARAAGRVPAILYGHKQTPVSLSVDPALLVKSLDKERKRNTVFSLQVTGGNGNGGGEQVTAMIRDVQLDAVSRKIVHIDFLRVSLDEEVSVTVPLVLVGTPAGVVDGGTLHHGVHQLPIAAKPDAIPVKVELDVSSLTIGQALHVSDLKLGAGVRVLLEAKEAIASVVAPKAEKSEAELAAEAAAAALPAAGEAGAAAPGAAAPAAGAGGEKAAAGAPAKKEGGEKKAK